MSIAAINWAWQQSCPSVGLKCTLMALADHADESGECWPGIERLVRKTSATRRTVIRYLGQLIQLGLIEKASRQRQDGGQTTNRYRLQLHACEPSAAPATGVKHTLPLAGPSVVAAREPDKPSQYGSRLEQQGNTNADPEPLSPIRAPILEGAPLPQGGCHADTGECHLDTGTTAQVTPGECHRDMGGCQPDLGGMTDEHGG
ncbi:MAG: helix-turn-helix domain-containing protein, partial [Candidatus Competibacteraceae bacterium]|nr:helix-turn-helix domain-containing protein [Candidatus Competibacteraceae bacterium]